MGNGAFRPPNAQKIAPVSYTHLDVYKRQVPDGELTVTFPVEVMVIEYIELPAAQLAITPLKVG